MKILHVVPSFYPASFYGGPIYSIHYLCQALARIGINIEVATSNANGVSKLDIQANSAVYLEKKYFVYYYDEIILGRLSFKFITNIKRHINSADIIHLHDIFSSYYLITIFWAFIKNKPILISPRGVFSDFAIKSKKYFFKMFWVYCFVKPFVLFNSKILWHATSAEEYEDIKSLLNTNNVRIVPNGMDISAFDNIQRPSSYEYLCEFFPRLTSPTSNFIKIVSLGRLHTIKQFDIAISVIFSLKTYFPNVLLLIAGGDDGDRARLSKLISQLQLDNNVTLVGELKGEKKLRFLKGADIYLMTSQTENFGMSCLEALSAGLPVVVSKGAPWGIVQEVDAGFWVENNCDEYVDAILSIIARSNSSMSINAKNLSKKFDVNIVAESYYKVYRELIGEL